MDIQILCHWVLRSSCVHLIAVALFHRMAWQRLWEVPMIHNLSLAPSWLLHFFGCFFIFILPLPAIFQVMASQQPNLQFFLLRHLGFCTFLSFVYLNIFSPYCVIFQKMAWQRKSPMIYNLSLSANFSSPNQFCFLLFVLSAGSKCLWTSPTLSQTFNANKAMQCFRRNTA